MGKPKGKWSNVTWSPVRGCTKISPGCTNCYAATFAEQFRGTPGHPYEQGFDLRLVPDKLAEPFSWKRPRLVFVCTMSDLFHEGVPDSYIQDVASIMEAASWHTFLVLTKRSERMRDLLQTKLRSAAERPHIWWGVSVENQRHGLPRIDHLRAAPAARRWLSIEPLLEDLGPLNLDGIGWVYMGPEHGSEARPEYELLDVIHDQCVEAGIPCCANLWSSVRKPRYGELSPARWRDFPQLIADPVPARRERQALRDAVLDRFVVKPSTNVT